MIVFFFAINHLYMLQKCYCTPDNRLKSLNIPTTLVSIEKINDVHTSLPLSELERSERVLFKHLLCTYYIDVQAIK